MAWSTMHIFGYGDTQLIGDGSNKKVKSSDLLGVQTVVDSMYAHKPVGNNASADPHAVNFFYETFVDFMPEIGDSFRIQWNDLTAQDLTQISDLVAEIEALP